MMNNAACALIGAAVLLSACAFDRPTYAETLRPWVGQSENRLFQSWGYPANQFYVTPETKVVTYIKFASHPMNGSTEPYASEVAYSAIDSQPYGLPAPTTSYSNYYCKTSFTIRNGQVVDYGFSGDDCVVTP